MPRTTRLSESVDPRDRVLPVVSSDGFRPADWLSIDGERMRIARVPADHLLVVDRRDARPAPHAKDAAVLREE